MKPLTILLTLILAASCASAPPPATEARSGSSTFGSAMGPGLDLLPLGDWWDDPDLARAVKLTPEQTIALNAFRDESASLDALRRDAASAARDLRLAVDGENPAAADIVAAGQRFRTARDLLLERQISLLARQRTILTQEQWTSLEAASRARAERRQRGRDNFGGRRGGYPGGYPGDPGGYPGRFPGDGPTWPN